MPFRSLLNGRVVCKIKDFFQFGSPVSQWAVSQWPSIGGCNPRAANWH
jgi:hypothetical protein